MVTLLNVWVRRIQEHARAVALGTIAATVILTGIIFHARQTAPASAIALHVAGNHIVNAQGQTVTLLGASRWGLEFDCHGDQHYTLADFQAMRSWGMNVVRLTLSSAYWLNLQNICPDYQRTVTTAIANAEKAGLYVMPVLQRESPFPHINEIEHGGSLYQMPDMNAIPFWQALAKRYAHDPRLIFELYTEPHDVSWAIWRDGGAVSTDSGPYQTPGMQTLVQLINRLAPNNLVVVGGLSYAYDLSGPTTTYAISGRNVVYATHPYDYSDKQPKDWARAFSVLAQHAPVVATEFGEFDGGSHYNKQVIDLFQHLQTGYVAWAWTAGTGNTDLLKPNVWNGTPSPYGQFIHDAMTHTRK